MQANAVVFKSPKQLELRGLDLRAPAAGEIEVDIEFVRGAVAYRADAEKWCAAGGRARRNRQRFQLHYARACCP